MLGQFGFIVIRHVAKLEHNRYWIHCCECITKHYPEVPIVIIDDDSSPEFTTLLRKEEGRFGDKLQVIESEFHGSGELLGYYYLHRNKLFEKAVVMHDSVFILQHIDFHIYKKVKFLWHFTHEWDDEKIEIEFLNFTNPPDDLELFYGDFGNWFGCFGTMAFIELSFLEKISFLLNLLPKIKTRYDRKRIERVFALTCCYYHPYLAREPSIFGIIHEYYKGWKYRYESYLEDNIPEGLPIVKVWVGR